MRTSQPFAGPANSTSDLSGTSNVLWRMTWQDRLLLLWCSHTWTNATQCFSASHHSIMTNFSVYRIFLPDLHSMIGIHLFSIIFVKLHWLPIHSCMQFKLLSENQPANLRSLLTPYAPPRLLRSSDKCLLTQPRTCTSIGKRTFSFSVCAPAVWNSIPLHIRLSLSLASFKRNLKTLFLSILGPLKLSSPQIRLYLHIYLFIYGLKLFDLFIWFIEHWRRVTNVCIIIIINISCSTIDNIRNSGIKSRKLFGFMRIAFLQLCKIAKRSDMNLKI